MSESSTGRCLNIDPARQPDLGFHRSGWAYALEALAPLHDPDGVLFDSFLERTFCWMERRERRLGRIPYQQPWVGILHNPPGIPAWHDVHNAPQALVERDSFRRSLPACCGLFTLSQYLRDWLAERVDVPVEALVHPTEIPEVRFTPERFLNNPQPAVIQIGWWLRRLHAIFLLPTRRLRKVMLSIRHQYFRKVLQRDRLQVRLSDAERDSVEVSPFVSDAVYDDLLSRNIAFCQLMDASANNTIIECIARDTPILVNRLPAVEEYLGRDYPLYFESLAEAAEKAEDTECILAAYEHLRSIPKERFSQQTFRETMSTSAIYRSLSSLCESRSSDDEETLASLPHCRGRACDDQGRHGELRLALVRTETGRIYVKRAEWFWPDAQRKDGMQRAWRELLCGRPLAEVRKLRLEDFQTRADGESSKARAAYDALRNLLGKV